MARAYRVCADDDSIRLWIGDNQQDVEDQHKDRYPDAKITGVTRSGRPYEYSRASRGYINTERMSAAERAQRERDQQEYRERRRREEEQWLAEVQHNREDRYFRSYYDMVASDPQPYTIRVNSNRSGFTPSEWFTVGTIRDGDALRMTAYVPGED